MHYKWRALALLWVAFFLQQGTRQIFGATLTSIQGSLGVIAAAIGAVATVFTFAYGLSVPFAGVAADLFNRKWMVVSGVFVFCLGIFASGFVASLGLLVVSYGILNGFGQSFYYPSATSIIGELHRETRATALSILQMGLYAGIIGVTLFDLIPQRYHASGAGLMLSCAFVFGSTSPVVLGLVKDAFSSTAALASLAAFYLAGAVVIFVARQLKFQNVATQC